MTPLALGLILVAAVIHATWNFAAKRAGGGLPFVWISSSIALGFYAVTGTTYWLWRQPVLPAGIWWIVLGSGALKTAYSLLLQRAYRHGEFSLVYPLTRGTAPLLATIGAIALFGERPSTLALAGSVIIVACIFYLTGGTALMHADRAHLRQGVWHGLACGTCVAIYTVWDRQAVSRLHLPPVLYDGGTQLVIFSVLTPFAWARRGEVASAWREHRGKAALVGLLSPIAYVLILTAMAFTPVSYVAPAREVSIVIGAFFGARLLKEADAPRRLLAAGGMVVGIVALALG